MTKQSIHKPPPKPVKVGHPIIDGRPFASVIAFSHPTSIGLQSAMIAIQLIFNHSKAATVFDKPSYCCTNYNYQFFLPEPTPLLQQKLHHAG